MADSSLLTSHFSLPTSPLLTSSPGVYLMKDAKGKIIYVGKAANLKKRVSSYFTKPGRSDLKTAILVDKISSFETIVTGTEKEALILEANLIKQYKPRYNVILKDDKRYPSLRLDTKNQYPSLEIVRKIKNDGALYFGPFPSSSSVYQTIRVINKTFMLRKCKTKDFRKRNRPCLNYQIESCLGPCCLEVDNEDYNEIVKEVVLFLKGKTPDLIKKIKKEMMAAADAHNYEKATVLRNRMFALEKTLEKQVSVTTDFMDRDVIAIARGNIPEPGNDNTPEPGNERIVITMLFVRSGYLLGTRHFDFKETLANDSEMIGTFISQYYEKAYFIPKEILVPVSLEDAPLIEESLKNLKGKKVNIIWPRRGEKASLLKMSAQNAENRLKDLVASSAAEEDILVRLRKKLNMDRIPERIECFDNSNISGTNPVAGMVVFENGKPSKSMYRRYKIRTVAGHNDYAYMEEALKRRYGKGEKSEPFPDLLMVDGGRGQLNIAVSVIKQLELAGHFEIIGIAKKDEAKDETEDKIYKPGRANAVNFGREKDLLFFLQRIRDEAHRYAVSFHRSRRRASSMNSVLDAIPGIGKKRKQMLLKHFGSIRNIREATIEEISALPGMNSKAAEAVKKELEN
ncbi:MAG: excinuclease ABC subunit UvrC [Desulfobacterales bacterium]|nr:excinuclease ABC subunit UvrC [Desulfobacterales bacterium]